MKKLIFKIFIISLSLGSLTACRDSIDIIQEGELNDEGTFTNVTNLKNYLNGIYGQLDNSAEIKFTSVFTDEVGIGNANSGQDTSVHRFFLDINDSYATTIWLQNYNIIMRINRLLEGANNITPTSAERAEYNDILAQAKALRAYSYIQLESYYSTDMKNADALGVIKIETPQALTSSMPRVKNSEIFTLIENDLDFAYNNSNATTLDGSTYFFVTKPMINALRAKFYLFTGDIPKAKLYANDVLANSNTQLTSATPLIPSTVNANLNTGLWNNNFYGTISGTNPIDPINPYRKMWNDSSRGEVIFGLSRPTTQAWGNIATLYTTNDTNLNGSVLFDMGRNLFNILNTTDTKQIGTNPQNILSGDVRRWAFVDPTSRLNANYATVDNYVATDVIVIDKYPGKFTRNQPLRNDIKVIRLSEIYFILAECAIVEGRLSDAAVYVNTVRKSRYFHTVPATPVYANETVAYADLLKERRVELCFEGHRYIDIKRLGTLANQAIDRNVTDDRIKTLPTTIPNGDYRFTLPIPLAEIQGNPNIVQNPGYN